MWYIHKFHRVTNRIFHNICPSCHSTRISRELTVRDHSVSGEEFEIWCCHDCSLRFTQNVPGEEGIGRYYQSENYISHTDTNKGIINRLYRAVRNYTLKNKKSIIQSLTRLSTGKLLDVGAGTGAFAAFMRKSGWTVTALEPDSLAREKAAGLHGLQLEDSSTLFKLKENQFDAITLWHVIEHVHSLHQYIDQLKKIVKPSGLIFIAVPNFTSDDASRYKEFWAAYDTPRHLYHFSPESMKKLIETHQLRIKKTIPMWFDSFYVSLLSEKYQSGHANLFKGFWNGTISNLKALMKKEKASSLIYIISK
jgi:2-polyprenyl-3-methyl-5-hydroxy-6-metoxy-1,4-benzoquinol methylase